MTAALHLLNTCNHEQPWKKRRISKRKVWLYPKGMMPYWPHSLRNNERPWLFSCDELQSREVCCGFWVTRWKKLQTTEVFMRKILVPGKFMNIRQHMAAVAF